MTSNPPPNGMARAYLCPVTHRVWRWNGGMYGADDYAATAADVHARRGLLTSIPEWSAANWDEPPEYVMAPDLDGRKDVEYIFHDPTDDDGWDYFQHGFYTLAAAEEAARTRPLYRRTDDHHEVLRRVWVREEVPSHVEKCVPISSVDWSAVHAGKAVPPSRVEVPGVDADGTPAPTDPKCFLEVWREGSSRFCLTPGEIEIWEGEAAHYTLDGHLLGHRTAGWREVSKKARTVTTAGLTGLSVRRPAPTNPGEVGGKLVDGPEPRGEWVDGKWVPNLAVCEPRGCTPQTKATFADEQAGLTHNGVITIMQDLARRRDLFDSLQMAYQTGAEPVAMSPEFFEALERQRGKR